MPTARLPRPRTDWLGRTSREAGCVPSSPVGKLLAADGSSRWPRAGRARCSKSNSPWARDYFAATAAAALEKPVVTISLIDHTLGY